MLKQKLIVALAFASMFAVGMGQVHRANADPVKNIVLVHGAFADGSSYAKVIPLLIAKGYHVTAVQNPLTSLADDMAATKRVLADATGPVVLVGHSWAGTVITDAGTEAAIVTAAAVAGALAIYRLALPTRLRFLFERPDAFRLKPKLHLAAQR